MHKYLLIAFIVFSFYGCSKAPKPEPKVQNLYPSWYLFPRFSDKNHLYGTAQSDTLQTAQKKALSSIASRLGVSISSTATITQTSMRDFREYTQEDVSFNIEAQTKKVEFYNYEVSKLHQLDNGTVIVEVKVDKNAFLRRLKQELQTTYETIKTQTSVVQNKNNITRFMTFKDSFNVLLAKKDTVAIIKALQPSYDETLYLQKVQDLYKQLQQIQQNTLFQIRSSAPSKVQQMLKTTLFNEGFQTTSQSDYVIKIQSYENHKNPKGFFLTDITVVVSVEFKNKSLKVMHFKSQGASSNSYADSVEDAYKNLSLTNLF